MNEKQKERAETLGLSQEKAEKILEELNVSEVELGDSQSSEWDREMGFEFPPDLIELFNTASRLNALFIRQTDIEFDRWRDYGESPDVFCKGFADAMDKCEKLISDLAEYAKALVTIELFEKYKD